MTNASIELSEVSTRFADVADRIRNGEEFQITLTGKMMALAFAGFAILMLTAGIMMGTQKK